MDRVSLSVEFLEEKVDRNCDTGMKKYITDMSWKRRIDNMQIGLQCCGIDSFEDWHKTYWVQREFLVLDSPDILR